MFVRICIYVALCGSAPVGRDIVISTWYNVDKLIML